MAQGAPGAGSFPNSFLVPGTQTSFKIGGYVKLDYTYDFGAQQTNGTGTGVPFVSPVSITSDRPGSIVVLDSEQPAGPGLGLGGLVRVDLATGDRSVISNNALPTGGQQFDTPIDVQYDACENAFYVLQTGFTPAAPDGRVLKVDGVTRVRTLFASYLGAENYALLLRPIVVVP